MHQQFYSLVAGGIYVYMLTKINLFSNRSLYFFDA